MRKRLLYGLGLALLILLTALIIWQGSFDFGEFGPATPEQTYTLWAVSTLIILLAVTLGFMLVRNFVKLYIERRQGKEGSRIRTKLVLAALALTCTPVFFLVFFSIEVLNRNLDKWFSRPAENIKLDLVRTALTISQEHRLKTLAASKWLASLPEVKSAGEGSLQPICRELNLESVILRRSDGQPVELCQLPQQPGAGELLTVQQPVAGGALLVASRVTADLAAVQNSIAQEIQKYDQLSKDKKATRTSYVLLLMLITLFILFFAVWVALFLARQISGPISALLEGAQRVRAGDLKHRVPVRATDELASLVRAFNEMTETLEANRQEIEERRRFIEAVLESIPTGVISIAENGRIQLINRALKGLLALDDTARPERLDDLFAPDDAREIRYLMNRARRLGLAASQFEVQVHNRALPLSVTVAALQAGAINSGYVIVLEDTSDLLRAQKAAAWHEVARRIAHEIKNPLTPISLCAERIARQLERGLTGNAQSVLAECSRLISTEVESLRNLVDEFARFSRFPAAQLAPSDLNTVVQSALHAFNGRLDGIELDCDLAPDLPAVNLDPEQFKRLIVNLIDNAAEAMQQSLVKRLNIRTSLAAPDSVELVIADTGCGISPQDREKLFLPYFTTKSRGAGLGLAIVNHIASEHNAQIRVEDNLPTGARFIIEIPVAPLPAQVPQVEVLT
jgi:PAS domain S-box-containing protein